MASIEERLTAAEQEIIRLREQITDTHTLAAHADRDVTEFRSELRAQTNLLSLNRQDMGELRENMASKSDVAELKAGVGQIVEMLQRLTNTTE